MTEARFEPGPPAIRPQRRQNSTTSGYSSLPPGLLISPGGEIISCHFIMVVSAKFNIKTRVHYFGIRQAPGFCPQVNGFLLGMKVPFFSGKPQQAGQRVRPPLGRWRSLGEGRGDSGSLSACKDGWGGGTSRQEDNSKTRIVRIPWSMLRLSFIKKKFSLLSKLLVCWFMESVMTSLYI